MERVLVVSAKADERENFWAAFSGRYSISTARGAGEAATYLQQQSADVVLVEMEASEDEGLTVLTRAADMNPRPVIIMLDKKNDLRRAIKIMRLGASDYLPDPADKGVIEDAIDKGLAARTLQCA